MNDRYSSEDKGIIDMALGMTPKPGSGDTDSSGGLGEQNSDDFFDQPMMKKRSLSSGVDFRDN